MVAESNMGDNNMRSKKLKLKCIEIALFIIKTETNGIRCDDLSRLVSKSIKNRLCSISTGTMGQFLISSVNSGIIYRSRTVEGNTVYHYNLSQKMETHGMET